jgi:GxxExxY protein
MYQNTELLEKAVTDKILRVFYRVYNYLGFGFLEKVYCNALAIEFAAEGIEFIREPKIDVYYKDNQIIGQYKSDFLVEGRVVVEVKATEILSHANQRQLLNCLSASVHEVGLLLHFGPKVHFDRFVHTNKPRA